VKIHKVRNPLWSRVNQFGDNKRWLIVGLAMDVLMQENMHRFTIGKNTDKVYSVESAKVLEVGEEHNSYYTSPRGKRCVMFPVEWCEVRLND
jgi:hypothetical protein